MKYVFLLITVLFSIGRWGSLPSVVKPWTAATVFYEVAPDVKPWKIKKLHRAMDTWAKATGVKFINNPKAFNRVVVVNGDGCSSIIGMLGGRQKLVFGDSCNRGALLHEIGHALGLPHEHQRYDRDHYVDVDVDCIERGAFLFESEDVEIFVAPILEKEVALQFIKMPLGTVPTFGKYDPNSVMHYYAGAFAKDVDCKTLTLLNSKKGDRLGRHTLSEMDKRRVKFMYYWSLRR